MIVDIKVPTPGESISEVEISSWHVADGDIVEKDQELAEIESDKATLALVAVESGKVKLLAKEGDTVKVNSVACTVDTDFAPEEGSSEEEEEEKLVKDEEIAPVADKKEPETPIASSAHENVKVSPLATKKMKEANVNVDDVINGLRRISVKDVEAVLANAGSDKVSVPSRSTGMVDHSAGRNVNRQKMTSLRKKLSKRLVAVKNETAMLTTFNEVDMTAVMALRKKYQSSFVDKYGVKIGFMSFFIKAASMALKQHPTVNAFLDDEEIVIPEYQDVSVAVQTPKGLMVPVIRNVEAKNLSDIELNLKQLADSARVGKIGLNEMTGGTFTVTNGGVFGSMLSTPIINPPQSAIMGMHNIVERPVAIDGKVEIRPIMYLALSYDHRIIDGKDSVGFLVKVKQMIENPSFLLHGGNDPEREVLGL